MLTDKNTAKQINILTKQIRNFFDNQDFLEVQTPIMTPFPGMEPHLTPFETTLNIHHQKPIPFYLNHSPELQMKKLLARNFGDIYNITKVFRDGEIGGPLHNPEFTMLEWYRKNADYKTIMIDCENLIKTLTNSSPTITYQNTTIDLTYPWQRVTTNELFIKHLNIDLNENKDAKIFKTKAEKNGFDTATATEWDNIYFTLFLNYIEPNLPKDRPIFITDYPASQAALAKLSTKNPFFAERFELYIANIELANAFSELIDGNEQKKRLKEEQALRKKLNKTVFPIDEEFITSLKSIHQPCAGIALGMDRLLMVLLDKTSIEDLLFFPQTYMINQQ